MHKLSLKVVGNSVGTLFFFSLSSKPFAASHALGTKPAFVSLIKEQTHLGGY